MALLGNLKIKTIAIAGNLLLALVAILGAASAYSGANTMAEKAGYVAENTIPSLMQISNLNALALEARVTLARHVLASDVAATRAHEERLAEQIEQFDKALTAYRPLLSNAEEARLYEAVVIRWTA